MKLSFLWIFLGALIMLSENGEATDVCASKPLYNQNDANKLCPDTCKNEGFSWTGVWVGKTTTDCRSYHPENIFGSICQCILKCTDVNISYTRDPDAPANWTASVWYTPCGATKEAGTAYHARQWKDNILRIASGTRVRIGPQGTNTNYVDEVMSGDHVDVLCTGIISGSDPVLKAHCERVQPTVLKKCSQVTIDYEPGTTWTASTTYTPCGALSDDEKQTEGSPLLKSYTVSIREGTQVQIGPLRTAITYFDKTVTGSSFNVRCSGKLFINSTCKPLVP